MRIGLACGPALGGVIGASMLRYHLFGPVTQEARWLIAPRVCMLVFFSGRAYVDSTGQFLSGT